MTWQLPSILYSNLLDYGTPVSSVTVDSGYSVLNLKDWRNYTFWQATGTGPFYITINCNAVKAADTLALFGHNLGTIGATVSLEGSSDNFSTDTTVALAGFVPTNDKVIYKYFTTQSKQYWRLKITVPASSSPRIAILCFAARLELPGVQGDFDPVPQRIQGESNVSQKGNLLGSITDFTEINPKPQWQNVDATWFKNNFIPFWDSHASKLTPFFWAWEPGDHADETFLVTVKADSGLAAPYQTGVNRNVSLDLIGMKEA